MPAEVVIRLAQVIILQETNLDVGLKVGRTTNTDLEAVKEIIQAAFELGANHFPFVPNRGLDIDQFLFEYQDDSLLSAQIAFLNERVATLDPRIQKADCSAKFIGRHITGFDIFILVNGQSGSVNVNV